MTSNAVTLANYLRRVFPGFLRSLEVTKQGEVSCVVRTPDLIPKFMEAIRDDANLQFKSIIDITGVDWPHREKRFDIVYHVLSMYNSNRLRVKTETDEVTPVPSLVPVFPGAGWLERETYDMFGVRFIGHPDLRRILTDYGFQGHPLRKDFPLSGYSEVRYDDSEKRVIYEPIELTQAYRAFQLASPWNTNMEPKTRIDAPAQEPAQEPAGQK